MARLDYEISIVAEGEEYGVYTFNVDEHANPAIVIYHPGGSAWVTMPPNNQPRKIKIELNGSLEEGSPFEEEEPPPEEVASEGSPLDEGQTEPSGGTVPPVEEDPLAV